MVVPDGSLVALEQNREEIRLAALNAGRYFADGPVGELEDGDTVGVVFVLEGVLRAGIAERRDVCDL